MKTIYSAVLGRLQEKASALKWIDWDKGQLKKMGQKDRPPVALPCALIGISVKPTKNLTDTIQMCRATLTIRLVFDPVITDRTSAAAPAGVREKALEPYNVIADTYAVLQGFYTDNFDTLTRIEQGEETHDKLFVYKIVFTCEFEDDTAVGGQ